MHSFNDLLPRNENIVSGVKTDGRFINISPRFVIFVIEKVRPNQSTADWRSEEADGCLSTIFSELIDFSPFPVLFGISLTDSQAEFKNENAGKVKSHSERIFHTRR